MDALLTGLGLAVPAGLNAYIPLLILGLAARFTNLVTLQPPFDLLASDAGLGFIGILLAIEVLADKVPVVDHLNDVVQTVIRPTAGAIVMLGSTSQVADVSPAVALILGILTAGSVHAMKATTRPVITTTTVGIGNPIVSLAEDLVAALIAIIALVAPVLVILVIVLILAGFVWDWRRVRQKKLPLISRQE